MMRGYLVSMRSRLPEDARSPLVAYINDEIARQRRLREFRVESYFTLTDMLLLRL